MDNFTMFNMKNLGGTSKNTFLSILQLKTNNNKNIGKLGAPGIVLKPPKKQYEETINETNPISSLLPNSPRNVYYPFPYLYTHRNAGMGIYTLNTSDILILDEPSIIDTHCIGSLSSINLKANDLRFDIDDYTKNGGGVTYLISNKESITKLIADIPYFVSSYKYNSLMSYVGGPGNIITSLEDRILASVSFIPLKYWIPLFNHKRVDGCGFIFRLISEQKAEKYKCIAKASIVEIYILCSNYVDNVFELDGNELMTPKPLRSEYISEIMNYNSTYEKRCYKRITSKKKSTLSKDRLSWGDVEEKVKNKKVSKPVKPLSSIATYYITGDTSSTSASTTGYY